MQPTSQQAAFVNALVATKANIALVARAGTGKTSTILMGVDAYAAKNPAHEVFVCAFNKAIANEVADKLIAAGHVGKNVRAGTIHSFGLSVVRATFREVKVDADKVYKLIDKHDFDPTFQTYRALLNQLVHMAKGEGVGHFADLPVGAASTWFQLADHYDVELPDTEPMARMVVHAAQVIFAESLAQTDVVDFDDMILWPLAKNLRVKYGKDLIIVDEAQDLSRAKQELVLRALKPTGRMVVVGDDRQAIYGFSGADAEALANLVGRLHAVTLPLSMTWRCPRTVVALAQALVPDIEAAPSAAEGLVLRTDEVDLATVGLTDAILCRNTAPLVALAYRLIRAGKPCKVEGRAIGESLIKMAQRWKVATIDALLNRLDTHLAAEVAKAKGDERKIETITDKVTTLQEICGACLTAGNKRVDDVVAFINNLFADDVSGVTTLATYHRSKGREWNKVTLYEHATRCPSPRAKQPWQKLQESNLAYVAITRSKHTLVFAGE